jgi:hypothetical protein
MKLNKLLKAGKKAAKETVSRAKKEVPELRAKLNKLKPKPKPKKPKSFLKERISKQRKEDALKLAGLYATTIPTATLMGIGVAEQNEQKRKAAEKRRKEEEKKRREEEKEKRKNAKKKAGGGMMKKKGYAKGGAARKGKPRGVGAALRGYGRALK